ncbi:MAG: lipid-binding SYLF domain-containing protein, partial [Terriglobales bacterium]
MQPNLPRWGVLLGVGALAVGLAVPLWLRADTSRTEDVHRMNASARVFQEVQRMPESGIPDYVLRGADCIAIIPGQKEGALGFGLNYGKGVATCRQGRSWGPPLFVTIGGASVGYQIGIQSVDLIMVFGNRSQLDSMLSSKFRMGASASAAAGPIGRHALAATDARLNAAILVYARSRGAFIGINLNGAVVQPDTTGNAAMYGDSASTARILNGGVPTPPEAKTLIGELDKSPITNPPPKPPAPPTPKKKMLSAISYQLSAISGGLGGQTFP